jgi:hypothetical protein
MEEKKETKICKHCQSEIPAKAKVCPNCRKKQGGMGCLGVILLVVGILIFLFAFIGMMGGSGSKDKNPQKVGEAESGDSTETEEPSNVFQVGDLVETDNFRITYESASEYEPDNEFLQAKDGYTYWEFKFKFENISDTDQTVSTLMDWECYADNSKVDQSWIESDNGLDATLSAGREAEGAVYFEVPTDAESIELEYDINFWQSDKIIFVGK